MAHDDAAVAARHDLLGSPGPLTGFVGTVSEAIGLVGRYRDVGIDMVTCADAKNDLENRELFVSRTTPRFD